MKSWPRKRSKYGNKEKCDPCSYGFSHRSKLELEVCNQIAWMERAGEVRMLGHEVRLVFPCKECGEKVIYIPDFKVQNLKTGEIYFIEAKGFETDKWPKVKRAWKRAGPGRLEIYKGKYQSPQLAETIIPDHRAQDEEACAVTA